MLKRIPAEVITYDQIVPIAPTVPTVPKVPAQDKVIETTEPVKDAVNVQEPRRLPEPEKEKKEVISMILVFTNFLTK